MKICCISDTHTQHEKLTPDMPECDILIHAGDITYTGRPEKLESFLRWFRQQPADHKVFIAGNHDWIFHKDKHLARSILSEYPEITYLQDSSTTIDGLHIWGSPWTPRFFDWAFNLDDDQLESAWEAIPHNADVVITHGPMWKIGDYVPERGDFTSPNFSPAHSAGCKFLRHALLKNVRPMLHVCGHIHEGYGTYGIDNDSIVSINASSLNGQYKYTNKPITISL